MSPSRQRLALSVLAVLGFGGAVGFAATSLPAKERHDTMESINDTAQPLFAMARKTAPFDAAVVGKNAATIAEKLKHAQGLFPAGSAEGTRAKPEIWTDAAGFAKAMKDGQDAAARLAAVKDEAAFAAAIGALGASCKACHEKYRAPQR